MHLPLAQTPLPLGEEGLEVLEALQALEALEVPHWWSHWVEERQARTRAPWSSNPTDLKSWDTTQKPPPVQLRRHGKQTKTVMMLGDYL